MDQKIVCFGAIVRRHRTRRGAVGCSGRRARGSVIRLGLGMVGSLLAAGRGVAQVSAPARLTDPHTMAMATRTEQAGEFKLDSLDPYRVSVPEQCVGTRRCPLLVSITHHVVMAEVRPGTDKNGVVLLNVEPDTDVERLDAALKQVFRRFALDPDKIAIMGRCATGPIAAAWGRHNPHVFNRVVQNSGGGLQPVDPQDKTTKVLNVGGLEEPAFVTAAAEVTQRLRRDGHPATLAVGFRGHEHQWEDYYFIARWLQESWATPNPAARPAPPAVADLLPILTTETLAQMTAFWTRFMQEPDSIKTIARRAHLRMVTLPIGETSSWIGMVDMTALAARYPSVAAALKAAGLTAQQHEAYRVALASAKLVGMPQAAREPLWTETLTKSLAANPALAQNVEFVRAHPDELKALDKTGMWRKP